MKTLNTHKLPVIDQAIIATNLLHIHALKVIKYETEKITPLIGINSLKEDGAEFQKKYFFPLFPDMKGQTEGIYYNVHYWRQFSAYNYILNIKCGISGGSYTASPPTSFSHCEELTVYLADKSMNVITKMQDPANWKEVNERYNRDSLFLLGAKAQEALGAYDSALKDIPYRFRKTMGFTN